MGDIFACGGVCCGGDVGDMGDIGSCEYWDVGRCWVTLGDIGYSHQYPMSPSSGEHGGL